MLCIEPLRVTMRAEMRVGFLDVLIEVGFGFISAAHRRNHSVHLFHFHVDFPRSLFLALR